MPEDGDPIDPRYDLLEQFQTLACDLWGEKRQARGIAARSRQAGDEPAPHRVGGPRENDGDGPGRLPRGQRGRCAGDHDDVDLERNQLGRESGGLLGRLGTPVFDRDVTALDVAEVTQSLEEGLSQMEARGRSTRQVADSRDVGCRVRPGSECRGDDVQSEGDRERSPYDHHAAAVVRCARRPRTARRRRRTGDTPRGGRRTCGVRPCAAHTRATAGLDRRPGS